MIVNALQNHLTTRRLTGAHINVGQLSNERAATKPKAGNPTARRVPVEALDLSKKEILT